MYEIELHSISWRSRANAQAIREKETSWQHGLPMRRHVEHCGSTLVFRWSQARDQPAVRHVQSQSLAHARIDDRHNLRCKTYGACSLLSHMLQSDQGAGCVPMPSRGL